MANIYVGGKAMDVQMKRVMSFLIVITMLLTLIPSNVVFGTASNLLNINFEGIAIGDVFGSNKFFTQVSSGDTPIIQEESIGGKTNHFLQMKGIASQQLVSQGVLGEGKTRIEMRLKLTGGQQQMILRYTSEEVYPLTTNGKIRLLNYDRADTTLSIVENSWYRFYMIVDDTSNTIYAGIQKEGDSTWVTASRSYTDNNIKVGSHLRFKTPTENTLGIDDILITYAPKVSLAEDGAMMSVKPELTFVTSADTPILKEHIVINGQKNLVESVESKGNGTFVAKLSSALDKNKSYQITLDGYVDQYGVEPDNFLANFKTKDTGLVMSEENGVWVIKNELSVVESAVIACSTYKNTKMQSWDFKKLSLGEGEQDTFNASNADAIMLMNNLSDCMPYEIRLKNNLTYKNAVSNDLIYIDSDKATEGLLVGSGKSSYSEKRLLILKAVRPNMSTVNLDTEVDKEKCINAVEVLYGIETDVDGRYDFTFSINGTSGNYNVSISGIETDERKQLNNIFVINPKDGDKLCEEIKNSKDVLGIKNAVETYNYTLNVDFEPLNSMTDNTEIYRYLFNEKNSGTIYSNPSQISYDMKKAAILLLINKENNSSKMLSVIEKYGDDVGFGEIETKDIWNHFSEIDKLSIMQECLQKNFSDFEEFLLHMQQISIFTAIEKTDKYADVKHYIEQFSAIFDVSLNNYSLYDNPSYVSKQMVNKKYNANNFKADFEKYLEEYIEEYNKSNSIPQPKNSKSSSLDFGEIVSPVPITPSTDTSNKANFIDLDTVPWAKEGILNLYSKGVISGFPDNTFRPNQAVTREEFVKMLITYFGLEDNKLETTFKDILNDAWYKPYVACAEKYGLVSGVGNEMFGVGTNITRQDMAVILTRTLKSLEQPLLSVVEVEFKDDNNISDYAKEAVYFLASTGVLNGTDGNFEPKTLCTRAQVAKVFYTLETIDNSDKEQLSTDVFEYDYNERGLLNALGIMVSDKPAKDFITRAEFCGELVKVFGFVNVLSVDDSFNLYSDVNSMTENSGAIAMLSELNIIAGYNNGKFNPDESISTQQAIASIGRALGYGLDYDDEKKIYYATIINGIPKFNEEFLTRTDAVHLFWSIMHKDRLNSNGLAGKLVTSENQTLMEVIFGIYKSSGVLSATNITSLDGAKTPIKGQIRIGYTTYNSLKFNEYLGYNLHYYYVLPNSKLDKQNNQLSSLLWAYPVKNDVTELNADNIISYSRGKLEYESESCSNETLNIPLGADIIYNGEAYPQFEDNMLMPKSGTVTIIDNGEYNTVIINEYTAMVLTKVSLDGEKLYFKNNDILDLKDFEYISIKRTDEVDIAVSDLKVGDIISVMQSKSGLVLLAIVSRDSIVGTIDSLSEDMLTLDNSEYYISKDFALSKNTLSIGSYITASMDHQNKIVWVQADETMSMQLGYLISSKETKGLENKKFVLLTSNDTIITVELKNNITIDGIRVSESDAATILCGSGTNVSQLIKYKLANDGKLMWIETAKNSEVYSDKISDLKNREELFVDVSSGQETIMYVSGVNTFGGKCMVDSSTTIFFVKTSWSSISNDDFYSGNIGGLKHNKKYKFVSYRTSGSKVSSDAIVIFDDDGQDAINSSTPISVVTKVTKGINDNGEIVPYISVIKQNKELSFYLNNEAVIKDEQGKQSYTMDGKNIDYTLKVGDSIRFSLNNKGELILANIIFDSSILKMTYSTNPNDTDFAGSQFHVIYASVYNFEDGVLQASQLEISNELKISNIEMYRGFASIPVYVCEKRGDKKIVRVGSEDDIVSYSMNTQGYSRVIITSRYGVPNAMVIYLAEVYD